MLYRLSDLLGWIGSRLYRRKLVLKNLQRAFPHHSKSEIAEIGRRYYRNLADMAIETIKLPELKPEAIMSRVKFVENEAYREVLKEPGPVLVYTLHISNWEWMNAACQLVLGKGRPVYKPLKNKKVNAYMIRSRSAFGAEPIPMKDLIRKIRGNHESIRVGLLADQTPSKRNKGRVWSELFGIPTAYYKGITALPYLTQFPCYFICSHRISRGYYEVELRKMGGPPFEKGKWQMLKLYIELCEEYIQRYPSEYLWSHNRWKYKPRENEEIIKFSDYKT